MMIVHFLQALHAFSLTDAQLCLSPSDPGRFVRCLAPYLKVRPVPSLAFT